MTTRTCSRTGRPGADGLERGMVQPWGYRGTLPSEVTAKCTANWRWTWRCDLAVHKSLNLRHLRPKLRLHRQIGGGIWRSTSRCAFVICVKNTTSTANSRSSWGGRDPKNDLSEPRLERTTFRRKCTCRPCSCAEFRELTANTQSHPAYRADVQESGRQVGRQLVGSSC
jgi:hypothetical protein